jgi:pyruvate/2-oxoglutarate dehydrogenase complex dihydrolipoamide dehydrogenase (E3) component
MASYKLLLLPGDGIGPEVMAEVERVVAWVNARGQTRIETETDLVGGCAYDAHGEAISDATMGRALKADAVMLGAVGGPKWDGVAYDQRAGVLVNERLQTSNPKIYAAGDICMDYKFTHAADAAARVVIQNSLFFGRKKLNTLTIPWCTYTDPDIAHVGLSEHDAAKQGIALQTFCIPMAEVDRALADGEEDGFVKIHVKHGTDQILGATIVARHAGEMINEITLNMTAKIGLGTLSSVIHPYPTQAEAIRKAGDAYNRTRLTPFVRKLFNSWLAWTR